MKSKELIRAIRRTNRAINRHDRRCTKWLLLVNQDQILRIYGTDAQTLSRVELPNTDATEFTTLLAVDDAKALVKAGLTAHGDNAQVTREAINFDNGETIALHPERIKDYPINLDNLINDPATARVQITIPVSRLKAELKDLTKYTNYFPLPDGDESTTADVDEHQDEMKRDSHHLCDIVVKPDEKVIIQSHHFKGAEHELGLATDDLEKPITVTINRTYLQKALMDLPAKSTITINIWNDLRPLLLESSTSNDSWVACPIRTPKQD